MDRVIEMQVDGYQIRRGSEVLGAMGTGNAVLLRFHFDTAWDGLSKCAKFTDARGEGGITTEVALLTRNADDSYTVPVPPEAMAYEGMAELSLIGELTENGCVTKRLTTKPLPLRIFSSGADREAQNTEPITATDKQQILAKVNAAEAYAVGTADGVPVPERETDNAKYYKYIAGLNAGSASSSAEIAKSHAETAKASAEDALDRSDTAGYYAGQARAWAEGVDAEGGDLASDSEQFENNAKFWATNAKKHYDNANTYADLASKYMGIAANHKNGAEKAKTDAEVAAASVAASAQLIAELEAHRYDAFPTETQSGVKEVYTDIGANEIPVTGARVYVTSGSGNIVLRQLGKNLFDPNTTFVKGLMAENGEVINNSNHIISDFIPVAPNTKYALSGNGVNGAGVRVYVAFYDADQLGCSAKCRIQSNTDTDIAPFTTPENCRFIRFSAPQQRYNDGNISFGGVYGRPVQLERGASVTDYAPYSAKDVTINAAAHGSYEPKPLTTMYGANTFRMITDAGVEATMDITYRIDPTLAYEKLKAAIVAAGAT